MFKKMSGRTNCSGVKLLQLFDGRTDPPIYAIVSIVEIAPTGKLRDNLSRIGTAAVVWQPRDLRWTIFSESSDLIAASVGYDVKNRAVQARSPRLAAHFGIRRLSEPLKSPRSSPPERLSLCDILTTCHARYATKVPCNGIRESR